jgi:DNA-binding response OmpR family regulator
MASVATCPCCGFDLYALRDFALGQLTIKDGVIVTWNEQRIHLTSNERLVVIALAKADGAAIGRAVLAEAAGYEGDEPENIVAQWRHRIEKAFRSIDPTFNAIETVWGVGLRWRTEKQRLLAA